VAAFVIKLSDVAPDGTSALLTRGVLNGTRRHSLAEPSPMVPEEVYELTVDLDATGWIFEAGHRIRLALSGSDFPNVWPTPFPALNRVSLGGTAPSRLVLPLAPAQLTGSRRPEFLPPPSALPTTEVIADAPVWEVQEDAMRGTTTVHIEHARRLRLPDGTELAERQRMRTTASKRDPAQASAEGETWVCRRHRGLVTEATARGTLTSSASTFDLTVDLEVLVDGRPHFQRRWSAPFPRLLL